MPLVVSVTRAEGIFKGETGSFVIMGEASRPVSDIADEGFGVGFGCVTRERFFLVNG